MSLFLEKHLEIAMNPFHLNLLILIIFISLKNIKCQKCPDFDDIALCSCKSSSFTNGSITCEKVNSVHQLLMVLQNCQGYETDSFFLKGSSLTYIPKNAFHDVVFKILSFQQDIFNNLFEDVPEDPGVRLIYFKEVYVLRGWDWTPFSAFKHLKEIDGISLKLTGLSNFRKYAPRSLEKIYFRNCSVRKLRKDEFQDFLELRSITIRYDRIQELKRSMFPKPAKLHLMDFTNNMISSLPEDLFQDMKLEVVEFSNNRLTVLPENTFKPILEAFLIFRGNLLKCDCGMKWITSAKKRQGRCDSPNIVKDKRLQDLKPEDFKRCKLFV